MRGAQRRILGAARGGPSLRSYGSKTLYIAHRGAPWLFPEHSMEAYRACLAAGFPSIEQDVHVLADGTLGVMHDDTVDRVTTGSGNTADQTSSSWAALNMDSDAWLGGTFGDALHPPMLPAVLAEFKGRAIFTVESKAGSHVPLLSALKAAGIRGDQVLLGEFGTAAGTAAVAAGYQGYYGNNDNSTAALATVVAAGIPWVALPDTVLDGTIATWIAAGRKVLLYTTDRRNVRDAKLNLGVSGFFTDDPAYLGRNTPYATQDTWSTGNWMPGMFDDNMGTGPTTRGRFYPDGRWGWADTGKRHGYQGWLCPIKGNPAADDFSITFKVKFGNPTNSSRWAAVFVADATMSDQKFSDDSLASENGYHLLMRTTSGVIDVYKTVAGADTLLQSVSTTAIAVDEEVQYRVTVTPTTIALYRLDGSGSITHSNVVSNTQFRGGFIHFGHNGVAAQFSQVAVT
jgi:glycerophosphoryl diester phosphodiesterase